MNKKWILPVIIIALALLVGLFLDSGDDVPFSSSSTGERGVSLLFDTLRHMDYPVRRSYRPFSFQTNTDYVYIFVQPRTPPVNHYKVKEMLYWVQNGGRLIFLCNRFPYTVIDYFLDSPGVDMGGFRQYRVGIGEVITGSAFPLMNVILMEDSSPGQTVQTTLERWRGGRGFENIFFAEYYHGFHTPETFVGRLPIVMQLVIAQAVILAVIALWHLGKRFGNPVPVYEEVEREENEYVRALARLYMESDRRSKK